MVLLFFIAAPVALIIPPAALFPYRNCKVVLALALAVFAAAIMLLFFVSKIYALAVWLPLSLAVWLVKADMMIRARAEPVE